MPLMYSVSEFCRAHGISRGTFYKLIAKKRGPKIAKIGRRTLISAEAAEEWRRRIEQPAATGTLGPKSTPGAEPARPKPPKCYTREEATEIVARVIREVEAKKQRTPAQ